MQMMNVSSVLSELVEFKLKMNPDATRSLNFDVASYRIPWCMFN